MQYKDDFISPERLYSLIGESIRQLRKQKNMTQEQLAELIGSDQKYISKIEIGKARPGLVTCLRIANAFQVSIDCFLKDAIEISNKAEQDDPVQQVISKQPERKLTQNLLLAVFQYLQEKEETNRLNLSAKGEQ